MGTYKDLIDYEVCTISDDNFEAYPFLNENYDAIILNTSCSPEERLVFDKLVNFVKHDNLVEGGWWFYKIDDIMDCGIDSPSIPQDAEGYADLMIKVFEVVDDIQEINNGILTFRMVPKGFEDDFIRGLRLEESAYNATFHKECNDKKVLFLDTSFYDNNGDVSFRAMNFMELYHPSMIKIIKYKQ